MVRSYRQSDLDAITRIHQNFYSDEFELPNFLFDYHCAYSVVEDEKIITTGGLRSIAEIVAVTDKSLSPRKRTEALELLLQALAFTAKRHNFDQMHVFIQDTQWLDQLIKKGFRKTVGQSLVIDV